MKLSCTNLGSGTHYSTRRNIVIDQIPYLMSFPILFGLALVPVVAQGSEVGGLVVAGALAGYHSHLVIARRYNDYSSWIRESVEADVRGLGWNIVHLPWFLGALMGWLAVLFELASTELSFATLINLQNWS